VYITKDKIVNRLSHNIEVICKKLIEPLSTDNKENFILPLNVTKIEMRNIINKIIIGLPVTFFIDYSHSTVNAIEEYITKEYIFFQAQEDITSEDFTDRLIYFIYNLRNEISIALLQDNFVRV
jgi:hypothetical protein